MINLLENPAQLAVIDSKNKTSVSDKLYDHSDHVII